MRSGLSNIFILLSKIETNDLPWLILIYAGFSQKSIAIFAHPRQGPEAGDRALAWLLRISAGQDPGGLPPAAAASRRVYRALA